MKWTPRWVLGVAALACAIYAGRVWAGGVPESEALTYSGTLQDATGAPLTGEHNVQLTFWNARDMAQAKQVCEVRSTAVDLRSSGHFSVSLKDDCTQAVHDHAELWVEVIVDGSSLGTSRLGAVPYALEAQHATSADEIRAGTSLHTQLHALVPPKAIVNAHLSAEEISENFDDTGLGKSDAAYVGWAICNGQNGTPNLDGRFARLSTLGAGSMGGSDTNDHTHAIDHDHDQFSSHEEAAHTHSVPGHQHLIPIGFDGNNQFWVAGDDRGPLYGSTVINALRTAPNIGSFGAAPARIALTQTGGEASTSAGSGHSHTIDPPPLTAASGGASSSDNRPAFVELVPLMRL